MSIIQGAALVVVIVILVFLAAVFLVPGLNKKVSQNDQAQIASSPAPLVQSPAKETIPPTVKISSKPGIGNFLTDSRGMTLYYFANDSAGKSNCGGNCANTWPPFYSANMDAVPGLNAAEFGALTRNDGVKQATYDGWPLYLYSKDINPGDANGQGFGGIWFVAATPFYTVLLENNTNAGLYLADASGKSLYVFANDSPISAQSAVSNCTDICAQNWPPFYIEKTKIIAPSAIKTTDFAEFTRGDGKKQLAYKGWPLYYHAKDAGSGDISGNGLNEIWFLANPAGFTPLVQSQPQTQPEIAPQIPAQPQYQNPASGYGY